MVAWWELWFWVLLLSNVVVVLLWVEGRECLERGMGSGMEKIVWCGAQKEWRRLEDEGG
jgi:hypothetical protein